MAIAVLCDIHGNLPALEAVLHEAAGLALERVVVGGDVVPGPMPRECLMRLARLPVPVSFVRGNGENDVLTVLAGRTPERVPLPFRDAVEWSAAQLDRSDSAWLGDWSETLSLESQLGHALICHATPTSDVAIATRVTIEERMIELFSGTNAQLVICGHTHMQYDRIAGDKRIVNAGSVGMPFGDPGAYWVLVGSEIELRRTQYDLAAAAARIRLTSFPGAGAFAERNVLTPPAEDVMLQSFSRQ